MAQSVGEHIKEVIVQAETRAHEVYGAEWRRGVGEVAARNESQAVWISELAYCMYLVGDALDKLMEPAVHEPPGQMTLDEARRIGDQVSIRPNQ
jgi:hypothetical protein